MGPMRVWIGSLAHSVEGVKKAMSVLLGSTFHAESSALADNIDVLSRSITALEKGVWQQFPSEPRRPCHPHLRRVFTGTRSAAVERHFHAKRFGED